MSNRLVRANQSFSRRCLRSRDGAVTLSEQWRKKYEYHKFKSLRPRELSFKSEKLEIDYITLNISMKGRNRSRKGHKDIY
jgi:hypothetical protein